MEVKIVIDSASDISVKEADELGIRMISMEVRFNDDVYLDGVDITPSEFYDKLIESSDLPQTSLINEYRWEELFKEETENGNELVVITISSKLSGTYAAAVEAAEKFNGKVFVVDSLNAAIGERLLCEYALRLIEQGKGASEIADELDEKKTKIKLLAMLNTLEYLKKGGRISSTVAFAGKLLSIKPVVSVVDGEVKLVGKAMGSKKANNLLTELVEKSSGIDFEMPLGVIYSGTDNTMLQKYVSDSSRLWEGYTKKLAEYQIGSTIGTHVGPGAIGVAFFEK